MGCGHGADAMKFVRHLVAGLLAVALLCTQNLHLPLLQAVAWAGMLATYSQQDDLATAVGKTFDGAHPCKLCCAIKRAESQPRESLQCAPVPVRPLTTPPAAICAPPAPEPSRIAFSIPHQRGLQFTPPPDVPPPRGLT